MAAGSWRVLLLVSVAAVLTPAWGLSQREAVDLALDSYNKGLDIDNIFRFVDYIKKSGPVNPSKPTLVRFTIQETVCRKSDNRVPDQCDFKRNGLVKVCTGTVFPATGSPSVSITCDGSIRTKRFFRGVGRLAGRFRRKISKSWRKIKEGYHRGRWGRRSRGQGGRAVPGGSPGEEENQEEQQ
ncbi:cathelicidin-6-like [Tachyglossus aculeatus]|uniref:cathelicidin-6-like n=1 Tax=Tachyglossus aculeatus TaxID=9261 RepID=UPI0018F3B711|nr:cathelicidin-6-like [Tachyglossus aculeatus]